MTSIVIGAVYNFGASDNTSRSCQEYPQLFWDAVSTSPLATGMMAHRNLHYDDEWMVLLRALYAHVGSTKGSFALAQPIMAVNAPAMPADVLVLIPPALRDVPEITMADFVPQVAPPPPPPPPQPIYDPHYGGGVQITGRDGKEVPRKNWRY
jgi:hypothetical protein